MVRTFPGALYTQNNHIFIIATASKACYILKLFHSLYITSYKKCLHVTTFKICHFVNNYQKKLRIVLCSICKAFSNDTSQAWIISPLIFLKNNFKQDFRFGATDIHIRHCVNFKCLAYFVKGIIAFTDGRTDTFATTIGFRSDPLGTEP